MPQDATCPACAHPFPVTEARQAFAVACPKCDSAMTVEFRKPAAAPEPGQPHYDLFVSAGAPAAPDAAAPAPKRAREHDEPKPKGRSAAVVFVSGGLGLLFVLTGLGVTGWFLFTQIDTTPASASRGNTNTYRPSPPTARPNGPTVPPLITRPNEPTFPPPVGAPAVPPKPRLPLPPLPDPLDIRPAPVRVETTVKLPEPARALRVGGGGRFLVLHFPQARRFGVFDANEAKVVRYIPAPTGEPHFAAGMTKLVVFDPGTRMAFRYDLLTGRRELGTKIEVPPGTIEAFCMGHASAGPLLVGVSGKGAGLYDLGTFKELDLPADGLPLVGGTKQQLPGGLYWAGATGRVFGHTGNYGMPNGVKTVILGADRIEQHGQHIGTWFVMPGPDDRHVFAAGYGVVSERTTKVEGAAFSMGAGGGTASHLYLPAAHGPFYLHANTIGPGFGGDTTPQGTIRLFLHGTKEPFASFPNTVVSKYGWDGLKGFGVEHSLHLIPKAHLLVVVPDGRDELRLYPADLDKLLGGSGRAFLYVASLPPTRFEKGRALTYQVEARAKNGPVKFRVESGPPGLTVSATGLVQWPVPADFAEDRTDAILLLTDANGQEAYHTVSLTAK